jgi:3-deoxy-manno-octulosonate cytidylyltransferase (CMP-KDO synthetase)
MKNIAVIPARYGSTRFPGKPLALLAGMPIIQHVYQRVAATQLFSQVLVATDDQRIYDAVTGFGGQAVFTAADHPSGSDRIAEVAANLDVQIVVDVASLMHPLQDDVQNPNAVKVVCDQAGNALYFSRATIPFDRDATGSATYYKHIGVYAYRKEVLLAFTTLSPTPLEQCEKLEQLRLLEHGYRIRMVSTHYSGIGIDTPEDLAKAEEYMKIKADIDSV